MENKIPTAEEFLNNQDSYTKNKSTFPLGTGKIIEQNMIEFAKLHVEAALKAASENATNEDDWIFNGEDEIYVKGEIDKYSILNAYPLDNIK